MLYGLRDKYTTYIIKLNKNGKLVKAFTAVQLRYLKINEIITPSQHGFVPNKACMTNLLETLGIITDGLIKENQLTSYYLILPKLLIRFLMKNFF